jgi:hypothetical protein
MITRRREHIYILTCVGGGRWAQSAVVSCSWCQFVSVSSFHDSCLAPLLDPLWPFCPFSWTTRHYLLSRKDVPGHFTFMHFACRNSAILLELRSFRLHAIPLPYTLSSNPFHSNYMGQNTILAFYNRQTRILAFYNRQNRILAFYLNLFCTGQNCLLESAVRQSWDLTFYLHDQTRLSVNLGGNILYLCTKFESLKKL